VLTLAGELVDAHVHLTFATHGENPAARGSPQIQEIYLREQAAAGVTLVRDRGAVPEVRPQAVPCSRKWRRAGR
jgi:imidazolonepropionase-like amidohydrolase